MTISNAFQDTRLDVLFPQTDFWPDTAKITTPLSDSARDDHGFRTGVGSNVATGLACRVMPMLGRFARNEGFLDVPAVNADFLALLAWRADIDESMIFVITASDNTEWVNAKFDIVLVMDPDGTHSHLELALNRKETN